MASRIISKTELRDRIRAELADLGEDTIVVTERGQPVAVVVGVERWNDLQLTLEDLEDQVAVLEHRLGVGGGMPAEQVFAAIEAEEADVPARGRATG